MLMIHIKKYYEGITSEEIGTKRYNSLEISPVHIHKDKKAHKDALLTLGDEIVTHIHGRQYSCWELFFRYCIHQSCSRTLNLSWMRSWLSGR